MVKTKRLKISKPKLKPKQKIDETEELREAIIRGMQEKKGHEIVSLDLRKTDCSIADCFVVCHGDSRPQVEAIARSVEEQVYKKLKENPLHKEGFENLEWVLLDFFSIIVHIFVKDSREFYGIERLWADAEIQEVVNN